MKSRWRFFNGRYEHQWEDIEFDLKEYNQLLRDTKEEVAKIRAEQREAQVKLDKKKEMLVKWAKEKEKEAGKISMDAVEELLNRKHTIFVSVLIALLTPTRSLNHTNRSSSQRQRVEGRDQGGRQDREGESRDNPGGDEAGDTRQI